MKHWIFTLLLTSLMHPFPPKIDYSRDANRTLKSGNSFPETKEHLIIPNKSFSNKFCNPLQASKTSSKALFSHYSCVPRHNFFYPDLIKSGSDKYPILPEGAENSLSGEYENDHIKKATAICPPLTDINLSFVGITNATFTYHSSGNPVQFEYGAVGFQLGTGTTGTISSGIGTISGLSSASCYDVYLRTDCTAGGNGTSVWSGPFSFCTLCLTQSLPYQENFDNGLGCFVALDRGNTVDTWVQVGPATTTSSALGLNGSAGWVEVDSDNAGSVGVSMDEVLLSSYIDASSITGTLYLEFDQFYQHLGSNGIVEVWDGVAWIGLLNQVATIGGFGNPQHQKINLTSYANDSLQVRFVYKDNGSKAWWWLIDNVLIHEEFCARSSNFQASFVLSNSVGLSWDPGSGSVFGIEYGPAGFTPGTGTFLSTTDSSITISGLSSQTTYDFYLTDSCGGIASIPVFLSALTSCALSSPAVLPIIEDFESYSSGPSFTTADLLCMPSYSWRMSPRASGRFRLQADSSLIRNGIQAITIDQSTYVPGFPENELTMTVDLSNYTTANGITLSFYYQRPTSITRPGNKVLVRGSATDAWIQIATMNSPSLGFYDSIIGLDIVGPLDQLGQTVSSTTQIKFIQSGISSAFSSSCCDGITIDDLSLKASSCPKPGMLSISNLFDTTATLNWSGTATNFQYWFGPSGFYQGTATTAGVKAYSLGPGVIVDTLNQSSCYEFLVRAVCSPGDSSKWEGPYQFCTPCGPISAPYYEDWNTYSPTSKDVGCYRIIEDASFNNSINAGIRIVDFHSYNPHTPPNYLIMDNTFLVNAPLSLISPPTTDLIDGDKRVDFFARATANASPSMALIVGTFSNGADPNTFHPIDTIYPDRKSFTPYFVEFTAANGYNGTDAFYGFMHGQTGAFQTILIDDIMYETIPSCVRPTGIQQDSADLNQIHLSWTSNGVGSSWEIEYGPLGFSPGFGTTVIANSNPYTLTGLTPFTSYDIYLTEICGQGDSSHQVGPVQMSTTICPAANQCWFRYDLLDSNGDGWNNGLVEVRLNGIALTTLGLGFSTGSVYSDSLLLCANYNTSIAVSQTGGWPSEMGIVIFNPWGDTALYYPANNTTSLNTIMGTFTALCTAPSCAAPSKIIQTNSGLTDIGISFTANGTGGNYQVSSGLTGHLAGSGTTITTTSTSYTITGLNPATNYDVYVREICAPGDTSAWAGPVQMSTEICALVNKCWFGFDLLDAVGDGWNGGLIEVRQNGITIATLGHGFSSGSIFSDSLLLCDNFSTSIVVSKTGRWPSEMGIVMYTPWGDTAVYYPSSGTTGLNTLMGTFTALCTPPTCLAPSGIIQTSSGLIDIGMRFTANGNGGNYQVSYGVPGHLAGTGIIISTTSTSNTITGLNAVTRYDVYVREICGPGDTSAWIGPVQMNTSNCPASQQCVFDFDLTDSYGVGWSGAEITIYQNGIEVGKLGQNFSSGSWYHDSLSLCDSLPTDIVLTKSGAWPADLGFYVYNPNGKLLALHLPNLSTAQGDTLASFIAYCSGNTAIPCPPPDSLRATSNVRCDAIQIDWNGNPSGSLIEYGPVGFTPGTGTLTAAINGPYLIRGLSPGTTYDVYVANLCKNDTSSFTQANFSTASGPISVARYSLGSTVSTSSYSLFVDASGSTNANSYEWDFGNGITSTNAADTMVYLGNGVYTVTLIVSNACGSDTTTFTVNVNIGLDENPIANSLNVYPNPADHQVIVSFDAVNSADATIRLLDAQGREILSTRERAAAGKFSYKLDVSELASGIYFIEITSGELSAHRRLSVK